MSMSKDLDLAKAIAGGKLVTLPLLVHKNFAYVEYGKDEAGNLKGLSIKDASFFAFQMEGGQYLLIPYPKLRDMGHAAFKAASTQKGKDGADYVKIPAAEFFGQ